MAGNIKGLTLEIGGNTTKLTSALKEPANETRRLRSELKDVDGALRFDTKNVDLLNQKQRLLTQTVDSTDQELTLLKEAQKQYIESGKDIDGAEYVALEKKIAITEKALENLQNQQSNFNGELQALGMRVGEFGEKTEALGKKFLPVTAGVTAVGAAAVASFNELDAGYDTIVTKTGATGEVLDGLTNSMDNVFGNLPIEAEEAGVAIGEVNTRFGLTGDKLEDLSEQFIMFSKINETDLNNAIGMVNKNLQVFGLTSDDAQGYLGILTERAQATGISVDDLMNSVQKNGPVFKEMGLSIDESVNLLAQFEKNGVNADSALAGLRKAQQQATKEGKTLSDSLGETITKIKGASSETEALQIATDLFGKKGAAEMTQAIREGRFSVEDLSASLGNFGSTVQDTFEGTLDPPDKLKVALNNVKIVGADLGATMMEMVAPMLEKLVDKVKACVEWFKGLSEGQKETIIKLGAFAAAIGPVLIGVGKMAGEISTLIEYFGSTQTMGGKVIGMIEGLSGASSIGVGAFAGIAAAVAAVGGAFVTLWTTNEEFRNTMIGIWESIVGKVQEFCQGIVDRINALGFNFEDITEIIKAVWKEFCDFLAPIFEGVWKQVEVIVSAALDIVLGIVDTFIALFQGDWDGFWKGIQEVWDACWNYVNDTVKNVLDTILGLVSEFLSWFGVEWAPNFEEINQKWQEIWGSIGNFIDEIINAIQELVAGFIDLFNGDWDGFCAHVTEAWNILWEGIKQFGSDIWNAIKDLFSGVWENIKQIFSDIMQAIKSKCEEIWNNIQNFLSGIWDGIKGTCQNVWTIIKDAIINPITDAWNSVQTIFGNIQSWITDKINAARDAVGNAIEAIKGFFNFEFHWPHIPLPHFSISGSANPLDWFDQGLPSIGVDWYAKAMNNGMILNQPTAFGINSATGQIMAGGEAGPEAVIGVNSLRQIINDAVEQAAQRKLQEIRMSVDVNQNAGTLEIDYEKLTSAMAAGLANVDLNAVFSVDKQILARLLLPLIDTGLEQRKKRR